jgi:SAM-dependent methyltransferase
MSTERTQQLSHTRESWDRATALHNQHKDDQVAFLRGGGDTLFSEELELLGDLAGKTVLHMQCNSGQDSLCLARRGAVVHGVDFSPVAVEFARGLSRDTGLTATFEEAEALTWMSSTPRTFERVFASYGVLTWHPDVDAWMRGAARVLAPGGRLVCMEFHPLIWSFGKDLGFTGDDYFQRGPFVEPVNDYVGESGAALGASGALPVQGNDAPAYGYQHGLGEIVTAVARAGLQLESLHEYPHSNGFRAHARLEPGADRRWRWPAGLARAPLMFGLAAHKP